ncbi:hypothetical protein ACFQ2M_22355 [Kitasatospora saccharophila]|uniref:hypothetical protein n=1 Tax=Kitasatospora saccharophila TaxID=407973 RepID=UPI0036359F3E
MKTGIILYGPPASGKDTITAALIEQDPRLAQFARLKIGGGRSQGYRMGTPANSASSKPAAASSTATTVTATST